MASGMLVSKSKYSFLIPLALFVYMGQMMLVLLMPCCNGLGSSTVDMADMKEQTSHHQHHASSMPQMAMSEEVHMNTGDHPEAHSLDCSLDCGFCGVASLAISATGNSQKVSDTNVNPLSYDSALLSASLDNPYKPPISA
jgi:hypothetical protein